MTRTLRSSSGACLSLGALALLVAACAAEPFDDSGEIASELTPTGLSAEYFPTLTLSGTPVRRTDPTVDFLWGRGSPAATIPVDGFSARWTGYVLPRYTETYTFITRSDDGVRLEVDGRRIIDNWTPHSATEDRGTIALTAGRPARIKLEYFDQGYSAVAQLFWSSPRQQREIVPSSQLRPALDRSALVPGTYRPGPDTTGPMPGTTLRRVDGDFAASADGQVIENLEVFGSIVLGKHKDVKIRNCVVWGTLRTGVDTAFIIASGDDYRGLVVEDTRLVGRGNPWCSGMRGGNYTMRRTEIKNAPDGLCLVSAVGNVTAEANWIHDGLYMEWGASTPNMPYARDYYTHTDGIQFHRGKNYVFRGNMIGGVRVPAGKHHTGVADAIRSGDDMYNAALMIKQEVDESAANKIENVVIEKNWLQGGMATINIAGGRGNTFQSTYIRDNRFIRSTWGAQHYVLRGSGLGVFQDNVFDDDGSPVPISRGD